MSIQNRALLYRLWEVVERVSDGSLLLSVGFQLRHPELYESALQVFGSWEATLAHLVVFVRDHEKLEQEDLSVDVSEDVVSDEPRERDPAADDPVWGLTSTGEIVCLEAQELLLSSAPQELAWPEAFGLLRGVVHEGAFSDVTVFTRHGLYFGVMKDLAPKASGLEGVSTLHDSLEMAPDDGVVAVLASHRLRQRDDRLLHVTALGKAKASEVREYTPVMGRSGREAFLLNDDDLPIAVLIGEEINGLYCASAMGQGIHMSAQDIRTMGRKSVGVNVMKLADEHDRVVSAFLTDGVEQIAVLTAHGYGKRLSFREFRKQGRGGAGMQVLRLNPNDHVVGVVPCTELSDLLLTTNAGRIWRVPASRFTSMGRSARGKRVFELQDGEECISLSALPCGGNMVS